MSGRLFTEYKEVFGACDDPDFASLDSGERLERGSQLLGGTLSNGSSARSETGLQRHSAQRHKGTRRQEHEIPKIGCRCSWRLTFEMSGGRGQAKLAGGRPLDGGVRRHFTS